MRHTLSLVAYPGTSIRWQLGDQLLVTVLEDDPPVSRLYRVIYADPNRISLEIVA